MEALKDRILTDGKNLGHGILKVDGFINHQVDPYLMNQCGEEFARRFAHTNPEKILTAEISGIAPALTTGFHMGIPVIYARKSKPVTMTSDIYLTISPSHTKGRMTELMVSPEFLGADERVLIIDDFLASGLTIMALARLVKAAGSTIVGIGTLVEKSFEGGRELLSILDVPVESLATITDMSNGKLVLA
ncbi:MAG: xanthine phosphoribosyltransferase [Chloroflexota bacterium]